MTKILFRLTRIVVALLLCVGVIELCSRAVHRGKASLLPYYFEQGATILPRSYDRWTSFYGGPAIRYTTDGWGARIGNPALADERLQDGILVIGDSQMLGYMVDFHKTFASRVALSLAGDADAARLLAAPAAHPGTLRAAVEKYVPAPAKQRLVIVGLNLGNDLDEIYGAGITVPVDSSALNRWLLRNSYAYMDLVLFRSHRLQVGDQPIGINSIIYLLDSQERVILAREAVRLMDELLSDSRIDADHKLVIITPADIQIDPKEFLKYRSYYKSGVEFEKWNQQVAASGGTMNAVEEYIARQLERRGHHVIRFSKLVTPAQKASALFDRTSHHLNADSHELLATAIIEEVQRRLAHGSVSSGSTIAH